MQISIILGSLILCGALVVLWLWERRRREKFMGIHSLPLLPFIGNTHQFLTSGNGQVIFNHLVRATECCNNNNGRMVIWIGPQPFFVVQNPEDVKAITNAFIDKAYVYNFAKVWFGNGIFTAPSSLWKKNIKTVGGIFNANVVDDYSGVFNEQASKLVVQLMEEDGKGPFDILDKYLSYTTLEAICQTALGESNMSESGITTAEYHTAVNRCLELFIFRGLNILMHPEWIYKLTPAYRQMMKSVAVIHYISDEIIKKRKQERENIKNIEKNNFKINNNVAEEPKFISYLDILLDVMDTNPNMTEEQIKSEVDTIIFAGQETLATALFFTFLMIGSHGNVQEKLYAELKTIFGKNKRSVKKEDLAAMKYLEAVINESLRLFPPAPAIMRYADRDLQLNSFTIPKDTNCIINIWGAGRSVYVWGKDADLFRPERWLEDQLPTSPASFLTFSYGRRACIGKKYAMAILKTVISHCVMEFEFSSQAEDLELKLDMILRAVSGHLISLRRRR